MKHLALAFVLALGPRSAVPLLSQPLPVFRRSRVASAAKGRCYRRQRHARPDRGKLLICGEI
jgi:hypothetical protein